MITYGFEPGFLEIDLNLARSIAATHVEVLPDWRRLPDPGLLRRTVADAGFVLHSCHASWARRSIGGNYVDLGNPGPRPHRESVDDLKRCADWFAAAGGGFLIVHPGGLSSSKKAERRRAALRDGLGELLEHVATYPMIVCLENMPPRVHPGSQMADLAGIVAEIDHPSLALIIDTGHAHLNGDLNQETLATNGLLKTTHVHDNDKTKDNHLPPGLGSIDWEAWIESLDRIGYDGVIMLECVRYLRENPISIDQRLLDRLDRLTRRREPT